MCHCLSGNLLWKNPERGRKASGNQLKGEKLAKTHVVLVFGLYLTTSSVVGEYLRAVGECSLRAPLGGREDVLYALCSKRGQSTQALSDLSEITGVSICVRKQTQVSWHKYSQKCGLHVDSFFSKWRDALVKEEDKCWNTQDLAKL